MIGHKPTNNKTFISKFNKKDNKDTSKIKSETTAFIRRCNIIAILVLKETKTAENNKKNMC